MISSEKTHENGIDSLPTGYGPITPAAGGAEKDLFAVDRGERAYYLGANPTDSVRLPMTRDGLEALVEAACNTFSPPLQVHWKAKSGLLGYFHHIENDVNTTTIEKIAQVLNKAMANILTWAVDQEIKLAEQEKLTEKRAKEVKAREETFAAQRLAKKDQKQARKAGARGTPAAEGPSDEKAA